ncbi:ABC transporter permease [Pleionea sediminis]|uniref:ABC transporter permease n=1 Tax=Pleionea sediminis TaxID=2569479 RepID=UPI001186A24B|nr:ABC transporter permease subunit [Pleionea sediminis]
MIKILLKQLTILILSFTGITIIFFSLAQLVPGDPVILHYGNLTPGTEQYENAYQELGLDESLVRQYLIFIKDVLQGDLGRSTVTNHSVLEEFFTFFPATIELSLFAILIALVFGVGAGVLAAVNKNTWIDNLVISSSLIGYSMPIFWWGMLLILLFSLNLGLTPVAGRISFVFDIEPVTGFMLIDTLLAYPKYEFAAFYDALLHLILPSVVLATVPLAVIARMTRSAMIEVLSADYILTAKAKGVSNFKIIWVHALRNALIPLVTVLGLQSSVLLTGAILTETIFAWPGVGKWMVEAIFRRDYPSIQGGVLLIAVFVILINATVDLLYAAINPRMRRPE